MVNYYFLSSNDSTNIYPDNKNSNFTMDLPQKIEGKYECALTEIRFNNPTAEELYVYCDIIEHNYVRNKFLPILRRVTDSTNFHKLYFFKVKQNRISKIRIYIRNSEDREPSLTGITTCTLAIKHVG